MKFNGTLLKLKITVGNTTVEVADTLDISMNLTVADIPATTRDSGGWEEVLAGVRGHNSKATGRVDMATAAGKAKYADLVAYGIARSFVNFEFSTGVSGDKSYTGSALMSNVGLSAAHEGEVTWTMDLKGSGALVPATIV